MPAVAFEGSSEDKQRQRYHSWVQWSCRGDEQPVFGVVEEAEGKVESNWGAEEGEGGSEGEYNSFAEQVKGEKGEGMMIS